MTGSPVKLIGESGVVVFDGTMEPPGGGAHLQAVYGNGNAVTIGNGLGGQLTWDAPPVGTELLDRSNPATPLFLAPGTYAVTASVESFGALSVGGYCVGVLTMADVGTLGGIASEHPDTGGVILPILAVVSDISLPLIVAINNFDGANSVDYFLEGAVIVKLA